jgi:hypothetical protein
VIEVTMVEADDIRGAGASERQDQLAQRADELKQKADELAAFRDAGVLTEAELEEQMARFRWNLA